MSIFVIILFNIWICSLSVYLKNQVCNLHISRPSYIFLTLVCIIFYVNDFYIIFTISLYFTLCNFTLELKFIPHWYNVMNTLASVLHFTLASKVVMCDTNLRCVYVYLIAQVNQNCRQFPVCDKKNYTVWKCYAVIWLTYYLKRCTFTFSIRQVF